MKFIISFLFFSLYDEHYTDDEEDQMDRQHVIELQWKKNPTSYNHLFQLSNQSKMLVSYMVDQLNSWESK